MANHKHSPLWLAIQKCKAISAVNRKLALKYIYNVERYSRAYAKDKKAEEKNYGIGPIYYANSSQLTIRDVYSVKHSPAFVLQMLFAWEKAHITHGNKLIKGDAAFTFWRIIYNHLEDMEYVEKEAAKLHKNIRLRTLKTKG